MKPQGIQVLYMDKNFTKFTDDIYFEYDDKGYSRWEVKPSEVKRSVITEWFESDLTAYENDAELLEDIYRRFQNGVGYGYGDLSMKFFTRSMMVGDQVVLQTNNRGPKRVYEVAGLGFKRIK